MAYVSANWGEEPNLQNKSLTITPEANWSGASTEYYEINPDSGYDALKKVNVRTPMLRDYTLMNVSQVETPSTVYNGDTARSNSEKMLRVAPSKTGMSYTNSYLEVPASSYMGDATAEDVAQGKTFSSAAGIAVTGTAKKGEDLKEPGLINVTGNQLYKGVVYNGDTPVGIQEKVLNVVPGKSGLVSTTGQYFVRANSAMGDATAADVVSGKTFSSGSGIQLTGTYTPPVTPQLNDYAWWGGTFEAAGYPSSLTFNLDAKINFNEGSHKTGDYYDPRGDDRVSDILIDCVLCADWANNNTAPGAKQLYHYHMNMAKDLYYYAPSASDQGGHHRPIKGGENSKMQISCTGNRFIVTLYESVASSNKKKGYMCTVCIMYKNL